MSARFAADVEDAFRFLEAEGFRIVQRTADQVRYESPAVWLEAWHDPRAEVDVSFGRIEKGRRESFSLWDVADFKRVSLRDPAYDPGQFAVKTVLEELAAFTREQCGPYLEGDAGAYRDLAEFQAVASGMTTQVASAQSRPSQLWLPISKAWSAGRLDEVARLIEDLPKPLTEWEARALEYAARLSRPASSPAAAGKDEPALTVAARSLVPLAHVGSIEASIAFYRLLGFEVANTFAPEGSEAPTWANLRSGQAQLMIALASEPVVASQQAVLFYCYCDNVPGLRDQLVAHGVAAGTIVTPFYAPRGEFRIQDPDGYVIMVTHT